MATQQDKTSVAFTEFKMAPCEDWSNWSEFYAAFNEMTAYISELQNIVAGHPKHKGPKVKNPQLDKIVHYTPNMQKALDLIEEDMRKYVPGFRIIPRQ